MAANWSFFVGECTGKCLGMLSGDDLIYSSYVPSIRMAIENVLRLLFSMEDWSVKNAKTGEKVKRCNLSLPSEYKRGRATAGLVHGLKASFASHCFLKSAFCAVGGFTEDYSLAQDWILQIELSLFGAF